MGAGSRWGVAVAAAMVCFGGCWAGLAAERVLDTGSQVGVASVPLVVVLAVLGAWAERARDKKPKDSSPGKVAASAEGSAQAQVTGLVSGGVVIGPGASLVNPVFSQGTLVDRDQKPLRDGVVAGSGGVLVVGDVPQEPAAFQLRAALMESLDQEPQARVSVVFAMTGIRGVGKTQVAAAHARRRIANRWRLVAWVDASNEASVLTGLAQLAVAAGIGPAEEDARVLAVTVRHWLEADGTRRLVVFDNMADPDVLRPFLPAGGAAQVIITSSRSLAAELGTSVPVDVFTEGEALAFLARRTELDDMVGARKLAAELGFLPLGLAQAAALIAREHLSYGTYLERLRALPVADYLRRSEGNAYQYRLAEAVDLSLRVVEDRDVSGRCARVMGLVAVLAETGTPRRVLHLAASAGVLSDTRITAVEADADIGELADASLVGFTANDSVVAHRLVKRVVLERLAAEGELPALLAAAVHALADLADEISLHDTAGVRELTEQVSAIVVCAASYPHAFTGEIYQSFLELRLESVRQLIALGDSTGVAIRAAEPLAVDCERLLGTDHPYTLASRQHLAVAYRVAGRTAEAVSLFERTLAGRERLGTDAHPDTLQLRNSLALAYQSAGRTAEAISLLERTLADSERVQGPDHADSVQLRSNLALAHQTQGQAVQAVALYERTLADREQLAFADPRDNLTMLNNLATAYQAAGRTAKAIALHEQTLADRERLLGADHPDTLQSRNNLASAYQAAGQTKESIPMLERTLADSERVLGADHPSTLTARNNLAQAYRAARRKPEAIALHQQTLAERERLLGADHPDTLQSRNNLAVAYRTPIGSRRKAIPLFERTLADSERVLGADHPSTLTSRNNLAMAFMSVGRVPEAITLFEQTLADFERVLGADHPNTRQVRRSLRLAALIGRLGGRGRS